jgi:hypothetical protein
LLKICLTIVVFVSQSSAVITFERRYGGSDDDVGCCVTQTTDGGYAIAGHTRSYGAGALDFYFIKTDSLGDILWTHTYGGIYTDSCFAMIRSSDGGYVLVGQTRSYGVGGAGDVYIIKIDSLGDSLWAKTYGGTEHDTGKDVVETSDGGYLIGGTTYSMGANSQMYLLRLDAQGDTSWTRTYGGVNYEGGSSVVETHDRCCLIAGHSRSFSPGGDDYDIYLAKTDSLGNTIWEQTFGNWGDNFCFSAIQTADSGFLVAGLNRYPQGFLYTDLTTINKTTSTGDSLWGHQLSGEMGYDVKQTVDGGYIVTGVFTDSAEVYAHLIKTDSLGNTIWAQNHGGPSLETWDLGLAVEQTNDGGYIVAGYTILHPLSIDERDVYLLKADTNGTLNVAESNQLDLDKDNMLFASPNPFRHFTLLNGMELEYEIISVYDVTGCLVQMVTNRTIGQDLKPGIYFLVCDEYLPTKLVKLE